jgi:hypothetical protein
MRLAITALKRWRIFIPFASCWFCHLSSDDNMTRLSLRLTTFYDPTFVAKCVKTSKIHISVTDQYDDNCMNHRNVYG